MQKKGLILTMGLKPDPLSFAIQQYQADYVAFIGTSESFEKSIDTIIEQTNLKASSYIRYEVEDSAEKIGVLVGELQKGLTWLIDKKITKGNILVDATGGRKWMSSGATMAASFLGLQMIYIDVDYPNGKPDPNTMKVVKLGNAYDQTGFIAAEQGRIAFNNSSFQTAADYFSNITPTDSIKNEFFKGLAMISKTFEKWDRFEHYSNKISSDFDKALVTIKRALATGNTNDNLNDFVNKLEAFISTIKNIETKSEPNSAFIVDLFLNAKRRKDVHRFDDSVARLYRTIEVVGQYLLKEKLKFDSSKPDFSKISSDALEKYKALGHSVESNTKLGLKQNFELLYCADIDQAKSVIKPGRKKSLNFILEPILNNRNNSILAHGFIPIKESDMDNFFDKAESLIMEVLSDYDTWVAKFTVPNMPMLEI